MGSTLPSDLTRRASETWYDFPHWQRIRNMLPNLQEPSAALALGLATEPLLVNTKVFTASCASGKHIRLSGHLTSHGNVDVLGLTGAANVHGRGA